MPKPVTVTFLGGLGEVGRNCMCIEQGGRILVLDCGVMFPDPSMPGVDAVLPDFTYLTDRPDDVEALIITHAHEDHVGGVVPLLRQLEVPLYGSELSMGVARHKVEEADLAHRTSFTAVADGERRRIGGFDVEFLPITHSVPMSLAVAVHSKQGVILHTGDFKLDYTPVDNRLTDLARMGALASDPGVRLLLADSTNADAPGHSDSETTVGETLRRLFRELEGRRIITSCFASHLHRVQQIADAAIDEGRVIFPVGRSMVNNVRLARELGVLDIPERHLRDIADMEDFPPEQVCVVCTGSQGEPFAALSLLAADDHRDFAVHPGDAVILSSHPIPGNESAVFGVIDKLVRKECEVIHSGQDHVHVTGHAKRDELRTLQSVVRPEFFVPIEGEYRMLVRHAGLATDLGMPSERVVVAVDGDQLRLTDQGIERGPGVPGAYRYVDGIIDDIGQPLLNERRNLAENGFVTVIVTIDGAARLVGDVEVVSRGWVDGKRSEHLLGDIEDTVRNALSGVKKKAGDDEVLKVVRRAAGSRVAELTRRRPEIIPVVTRVP